MSEGSPGLEYAKKRETKKSFRYCLWRRTYEVLKAIEEFAGEPIKDVIDLGTADGRMLDAVYQKYKGVRCVGVEYSQRLIDFAKEKFPHLNIIHGDIQLLDLPRNSFDVAIAAAVMEHVPDPSKVMGEVKRILRQGGIFILTSPAPFWERLATLVGHIKKGEHKTVMNLKQLKDLAAGSGFTILKAQRFMLSPVGMPFGSAIEKIIRSIHLNFLMANQLLVVKS